jgi:hypothetical protein
LIHAQNRLGNRTISIQSNYDSTSVIVQPYKAEAIKSDHKRIKTPGKTGHRKGRNSFICLIYGVILSRFCLKYKAFSIMDISNLAKKST